MQGLIPRRRISGNIFVSHLARSALSSHPAVEMAQWQDQVTGLQEQLESVEGKQAAAEAEKEHCEARQNALRESL